MLRGFTACRVKYGPRFPPNLNGLRMEPEPTFLKENGNRKAVKKAHGT